MHAAWFKKKKKLRFLLYLFYSCNLIIFFNLNKINIQLTFVNNLFYGVKKRSRANFVFVITT